MQWILAKKKRAVSALTIDEHAVTGLALARMGSAYEVLALERILLADSSVNTMITAIKTVQKRVCGRGRDVVTALRPSLTMQKQIVLPGELSARAFDQALAQHYQRCFKGEDLFVEHDVLGMAPGDPEQISVRLLAAKKTDVLGLEDLFQQAGLNLIAVDAAICAIERAARIFLHEQTIEGQGNVIVVFQATGLFFGVHNGRRFIYTRQEQYAAQKNDVAVAVSLIKRCWQWFAASHASLQCQYMILVSDNSLPIAIKSQCADAFACPVRVVDDIPWVNFGLALGNYSA